MYKTCIFKKFYAKCLQNTQLPLIIYSNLILLRQYIGAKSFTVNNFICAMMERVTRDYVFSERTTVGVPQQCPCEEPS